MNNTDAVSLWVVIPAAGVGKRMKSDTPKQYLSINDKTIIEHTLSCFSHHPAVDGIIVALSSEDEYWNDLALDTAVKPLYTVEGGGERSDSVLSALEYLLVVENAAEDSWVMVHDAARPFVSEYDINALLALSNDDCVGGILATPVRDTMKRTSENSIEISETVDRDNLWHALTPQLFRLGQLNSALIHCRDNHVQISDEASAMEIIGEKPRVVEASANNIKVTYPEDLELLKWLLSNKD